MALRLKNRKPRRESWSHRCRLTLVRSVRRKASKGTARLDLVQNIAWSPPFVGEQNRKRFIGTASGNDTASGELVRAAAHKFRHAAKPGTGVIVSFAIL
jgi:hypothetical protein